MNNYTVEIGGRIIDACVYSKNPKQAIMQTLKKFGYTISKGQLIKITDNVNNMIVAKVCLLGGIKESVSYYAIKDFTF